MPLAVIAGAVVVLIAGTLLVLGLVKDGDGDGKKAESGQRKQPDAVAGLNARVAQRLGGLPALSYRGTFTSDGTSVKAQLTVTKAGSATGSLTKGGKRAELVTIDGRTFLKAGTSFWREAVSSTARPEDFAGRWAKAPTTVLGFNIKEFLAPAAIAQRLRSAPAETGAESVGGRPAHKFSTAQGGYWASAAAPHSLVHVTGASDSRFDVTEVPDAKSLFSELHRRVAALGGARDPGVTFQPGTLQFTNCNENVKGCTVSLPVSSEAPAVAAPTPGDPAANAPTGGLPGGNSTNGGGTSASGTSGAPGGGSPSTTSSGGTGGGTGGSGGPGSGGTGSGGSDTPDAGSLRAVLLATITADGRTLGACTTTQPLGPTRRGVLTCTVSSPGWRDWMRKARDTPGRHEYSAQARVVAEAVAVTDVPKLVAAVDRERAAR